MSILSDEQTPLHQNSLSTVEHAEYVATNESHGGYFGAENTFYVCQGLFALMARCEAAFDI